jgi:hypothetical protein
MIGCAPVKEGETMIGIIRAAASFIAGAIGLADRQASALPPGTTIENAVIASAIGRTFESDCARHKAGSAFFNDGERISSYMEGPHGVRLPRFTMPEWARKC